MPMESYERVNSINAYTPARRCIKFSLDTCFLAHYSNEANILCINGVEGGEQALYEFHNKLHALSWNPQLEGSPELVWTVLHIDVCPQEPDIIAIAGADSAIELWERSRPNVAEAKRGAWDLEKSILSPVPTDNIGSHYTDVKFVPGSSHPVVSTEQYTMYWNIKTSQKLWEIPVGLFFLC
ncbi:hypothetical protein M422DRAFT_44584 [Sphaerobolus stellatus SS14]|nr:hypothetical protein M422DRAFT_44584 [Sphaerobolus stellatus SS14]